MQEQVPAAIAEEQRLVSQAKAGDSESLGTLCEKYRAQITRTASGILRNREAAEDAVQSAFVQVAKNIKGFAGKSTFYTWLTRIAINEAFMIRRRKLAKNEEQLEETTMFEEDDCPRAALLLTRNRRLEIAAEVIDLERKITVLTPEELALFDDCFDGQYASLEDVRNVAKLVETIIDMRDLQEAERTTLSLHHQHGNSVIKAAQSAKLPISTIKSRLHWARLALRELATAH